MHGLCFSLLSCLSLDQWVFFHLISSPSQEGEKAPRREGAREGSDRTAYGRDLAASQGQLTNSLLWSVQTGARISNSLCVLWFDSIGIASSTVIWLNFYTGFWCFFSSVLSHRSFSLRTGMLYVKFWSSFHKSFFGFMLLKVMSLSNSVNEISTINHSCEKNSHLPE